MLTTFFISISDKLPKTSYVKMIDLWLITNLLIPFIEIILQTLMNVWYKDGVDDRIVLSTNTNTKVNVHLNMCGICRNIWECEKLINMTRIVTRVALPAFYVLFCICFLVYGMAQ